MAIASFTPPYPLLFDYLLASSWTWFAIFLATIATSLRALFRHRLITAPHPPSSIPDSPLLFSSLAHLPSPPSTSSLKSFQRRSRSKSTSCLEKLHRNGEGFLRSSVEFLSSVLDSDLSPGLKKITSASNLFHGGSSCGKTQQNPWHCAFSPTTNSRRAEVHDWPKLGLDADDCLGSRLGLGFVSETLVQDNEDFCNAPFEEEQPHMNENLIPWLPSWAYSLCDPLQIKLSFPSVSSYSEDEDHDNSAAVGAIPCFEKQFGWDKLLESRLGSPWTSLARCCQFAEKSSDVVRMWPDQKKKLVKALDADALALDVCARKGVACTGNATGEISLWDLGGKAYSKASVSFPHPVVALSMNRDQGATVVGSSKGLGVWDQRSPICMSLGCGSAISTNNVTLSALKSRGNELCIAENDSSLSMYDLRMPLSKTLYWGPSVKRAPVDTDSDDEADANVLEKLTFDDDDDFWDEGSEISIGNGVELQKGSSLLSRFASYIRVVSTSV